MRQVPALLPHLATKVARHGAPRSRQYVLSSYGRGRQVRNGCRRLQLPLLPLLPVQLLLAWNSLAAAPYERGGTARGIVPGYSRGGTHRVGAPSWLGGASSGLDIRSTCTVPRGLRRRCRKALPPSRCTSRQGARGCTGGSLLPPCRCATMRSAYQICWRNSGSVAIRRTSPAVIPM